jgi:hypothetical protein
MTKLCSVCGTENREEAQFCRACGTGFSAPARTASDGANGLNVCSECGFQNKLGLRYCANCGMSLAGAAPDAGGGATYGAAGSDTGASPPPISYPSFATVGPYPPAPTEPGAPDIPDPDAAIALRQQEAEEQGSAAMFENAPPANRGPFVIGIVALALIVGGALAWMFMRESNPSPPAVGVTTPPVAATTPAASAAPAPIVVDAAPSVPSTTASAAVAESPAAVPSATTAGTRGAPPAAAAPLPQVTDPVSPESAEAEAKRVAAERRRERLAREKAEREAKALTEQRDQSATAAQRAEQEAQARRRGEEAQRARPAAAVSPPPPAPVAAQPRGVREICAGRGTIAEAVCQSRQCGQSQHANEPICRQLREQDERRRNYQN